MKTIALNNKKLLLVVTFLCSTFFAFSQTLDFYNLQFPEAGTQIQGGVYDVYAQVYEPGVTDLNNTAPGPGISAWIGFSTTNTNPNTWTDWIPANYNVDVGNNDEFVVNIGPSIPFTGTYYYASRFQYNAEPYVYGGILADGTAGGAWDGVTYISGVLTITCSSTTIWDGSAWVGGFPNTTTEVIIDDIFDTSAGLPQGSFNACSLTITANGSLRVANGDYVSVENDIIINGTFTVDYEGAVVQIDDNADVIGSATVSKQTAPMERFYEYTYWSSPVTGETIGNGLTDSDPGRRFRFEAGNFKDSFMENFNDNNLVPGYDDIDDDGNDWQFVTAATIMNPGVGYASHHEEAFFIGPGGPPYQFIYTFDGPFNNGEIVVPVVRNNNELPEEFNDINWNLIGNPYPSAIDIDLFFTENNYDATTNPDATLTGAIYLWSQNEPPSGTNNGNENQNFVSSDYAIINRIGEVPPADNEIAGGDNLLPARFIPSGQGFFVAYSDVRPTATGDVIFNNSMRVTGNNDQFFRMNSQQDNTFALKLTTSSGVFNQMLVGYVEGATNLKDEMYFDAPRNLSTGSSAIIYSIIEDSPRKFAIQGRDINSLNANDVIPIGVKNTINSNTQFTISVADIEGEFMHSNAIYLRDNLLDIEHNLSDSGYTFELEEGEYNSRFEIFFSGTLSVDDFNLESDELIISKLDDNKFEITTSDHSQITNIKMYDLIGRELMDIEGNNNTLFTLNTSSLSNSVFILHVTTAERKKLTKKFLNK